MKIAIISDTHKVLGKLVASLRRQAPDCVIHLGDGVREAALLKEELELKVYAVKGNMDSADDVMEMPGIKDTMVLELDGIRFFLTHGHRFGVKEDGAALLAEARRHKAEVVLHGHTHVFRDDRMGDIRVINPGSPILPKNGDKAGYVIFYTETGRLERIFLKES